MTFDPMEHMDIEERADFEVRQHLYAQRRLAEIDTVDTKAKIAKMLAEVVPKRQVCAMAVTVGGEEGSDKPKRIICGKPGVRLLALTGDWTCESCDPLRRPGPPVERCCGLDELEPCAEHDGPWECAAGLEGHGWPHRFTKLGRGSWE